MDITYRIIRRNQLSLLRVRFRRDNGESAVVEYRDVNEFLRLAGSLGTENAAVFHEDVNVLCQHPDGTHYRLGCELSPKELLTLKAPGFASAQQFALSFSRITDAGTQSARYVLKAKEWDAAGRTSAKIDQVFSQEKLSEHLKRVGLKPSQIRDEQMPGLGVCKVSEDQVELLFDPTKPDKD